MRLKEKMSNELLDQVAVITGGASGMGAATVREFVQAGAKVTLLDVNEEGAKEISQETGATAIIGDVSDSAFCTKAINDVVETHGRLDVLVNCAGTIHRADATGTNDDEWRQVMAVNVDAVFYLSRAAIHHMIAQKSGAIVNFGSIWGGVGAAGVLAYCTTKGAVHQLTKAMALDHVEDGIRINAVAPGEVNTPMLASGRPKAPSAQDLADLAEATIPIKRLAEPEEIAKAVRFLASDEASYITGAIIPVDGGYTSR